MTDSRRFTQMATAIFVAFITTLAASNAHATKPSDKEENRDECRTLTRSGKSESVADFDRMHAVFGGHPGLRAKFQLGERFGHGQLMSFEWNKAKAGNLVANIYALEQCQQVVLQTVQLDDRLSPVPTRVRKPGMKSGTPGFVRVTLVSEVPGQKPKQSVVGEYTITLEPSP
jgi:hypothetical protein